MCASLINKKNMSRNNMKGVSLFSSAGIAEAYFEEIGLNIQVANEIEKNVSFLNICIPIPK